MPEKGWEPGFIVAERYRLELKIGSGGMGQVWRAQHIKLRSPVAIKVLPQSVAADDTRSARFIREAQAAAAIRSTNVVQVLDYGVDDGVAYIAMEYLEGQSLQDRLEHRGKLSAKETLRIVTQVAKAIGRAHKKGIVHRDLKPGNIFMAREDEGEVVKVLDFGIAKLTTRTEQPGDKNTTQAGYLVGTPNYMSPEQARGHKVVDHRSDLWALGVVAFECLTGEHPVQGETIGDLIYKICSEDMPRPSKVAMVPVGFDAWFAQATRRDPEQRFHSAKDMAFALREALIESGAPSTDLGVDDMDTVDSSDSTNPPDPREMAMLDTLAAKKLSERVKDTGIERDPSWDTTGDKATAIEAPSSQESPSTLSEVTLDSFDDQKKADSSTPPSTSSLVAGESLREASALSRTASLSGVVRPRRRWWIGGAVLAAAAVVVVATLPGNEPETHAAPGAPIPPTGDPANGKPLPGPRPLTQPSPLTSRSASSPVTPSATASEGAPTASAAPSASASSRAGTRPAPIPAPPAPPGPKKIDFGI